MKILFRADGNAKIGSGHVMRCLAIADCASESSDSECVFVSADRELSGIIERHGYVDIVMDTEYDSMEGETEKFQNILSKEKPDVIFIDSYFVTKKYLSDVYKFCVDSGIRLIYIDDMLYFAYPCDMVLNYGILAETLESAYKEMYTRAGIGSPRLLLGTRFAPLRREFRSSFGRVTRKSGKDILVTTGGADNYHILIGMIDEIIRRGEEKHVFHLIIGSHNPDSQMIKEKASAHENICVYEKVNCMSRIMTKCDVAISASGSTLFELCATQTPSVIYTVADNQKSGAVGFSDRGLMEYCGDARDYDSKRIASLLLDKAAMLADDYEKRMRVSYAMRELVDGRGACRIINEMS